MGNAEAIKAVERAIAESQLAYQFAANSYTFGAYLEALKVRDTLVNPPDTLVNPPWLEQFLDWNSPV